MHREGHNALVAKLKPISQCKRTLKRKEKGTSLPGSSRNTALPSEVTHNLEIYPGACYIFLTVGTYKASQNPTGKTIMVGKSQPRHPEILISRFDDDNHHHAPPVADGKMPGC